MSIAFDVTDRVYREIRDLLRSGDILPGQRLPNERKLAEMRGASRTQVRDALLMLQKEGLVERKIGSGTYLSERAPQIIELADAAVHMSPERSHGFHETLEARLLVEPVGRGPCRRSADSAILQGPRSGAGTHPGGADLAPVQGGHLRVLTPLLRRGGQRIPVLDL